MPRLREHHRFTRRFLGYDILEIHRFMDAPAPRLGGGHRVIRHDAALLRIARDAWGQRGIRVAVVHILQDLGLLPSRV